MYHYTDRLSLDEIITSRVIRACSMTLHRDILGRDTGFETPPLVWLTVNPILDGTIVSKMLSGGWPKTLIGDLCRVRLPENYPAMGLADWTEAQGIAEDWWTWVVKTGHLAGSDYTTWRIASADVPASEWLDVETLAGFNDLGTTWTRRNK